MLRKLWLMLGGDACSDGAGGRVGSGWGGARGAGRVGELDDGQQAGPGDVGGDALEGLVHALRRRVERGVLPARRHGAGAVAGAGGDRRRDVRRSRERGHRSAGAARGSARAGLRADQHREVRPLSHHQDLRHGPAPLDGADPGPVRAVAAGRLSPVRALRPGDQQLLARGHRVADGAAGAALAHEPGRHPRGTGVGRRASRRRPAASSGRATAGRTCRTTGGSTSTTTPRPTATSCRPASCGSTRAAAAARRRTRSRSGSATPTGRPRPPRAAACAPASPAARPRYRSGVAPLPRLAAPRSRRPLRSGCARNTTSP